MSNSLKNHIVSLIGAIVFAVLLSGSVMAAEINPVLKRYMQGQYSNVLPEVSQLARAGNPEAQFALGLAYEQGRSVTLNPIMAMYWYQQAADTYQEQGASIASRFSREAIVRLQREHAGNQVASQE